MKIACLPRSYFEDIRGTALEAELLAANRVVSIQSASGWDSAPPFSEESLSSPHLLRLAFDDCYGIPDDPAERAKLALFTHEMAERILRFVDDAALPVLVHCTEGVSRAGAVASVLNEYYNRVVADHDDDYRSFFLHNRRISPNPYVLRVMKEAAGLSALD
jgi:predicted protein tyrosine phosphatase